MKKVILYLFVILQVMTASSQNNDNIWIRVNQLGYMTHDIKVAVLLSTERIKLKSFILVDSKTGKTLYTFRKLKETNPPEPFRSCYRLPFTTFTSAGTYRIVSGHATSPEFRISDELEYHHFHFT